MKKWYNVELDKHDAGILIEVLRGLGVLWQASECYNLTHIDMEMERDSKEYRTVERVLAAL